MRRNNMSTTVFVADKVTVIDSTIVIAIAVIAALVVIVIVIVVLFYCYKVKNRYRKFYKFPNDFGSVHVKLLYEML